jgi:ankyrin repeat protein
VQSGDLKAVRFALEQKPDINSASRLGETALHLVIKAGKDRCAIARELIKAEADPNREDKFKMTPLDQAIEQADTALADCLRALRPMRSSSK